MKFLNHNLFTGDITVSGITTLNTATGVTRATGDNSTHLATTAFVKNQGYATTAALAGYVPTSRTLSINGTTYDLSANRSWTISDSYLSNVVLNDSLLEFTGVNSAFSGSIDLSSIIPVVRTVYETVKNASGATILKGTPLAVVAGQTSGNVSDVVPANAADPTKMPAIFIANQDIPNEAEGEAVLFGNLTGVDTSAYISGTTVYVAPGGGWTATKPVWPNKIQNLGIITKQHPSNGAGIVTGVGRANDLPNLTAGKIWVGSANYPIESTTVHVDEANGRVGFGTVSPTSIVHIEGTTTGTGSGADAILHVKQNGGWDANEPWALYVEGYSYLNGFRINAADGVRALYKTTPGGQLGFAVSDNAPITFAQQNETYRLYIGSDGNVGINTTNPGAKLHVVGNTYIQSGVLFVDTIAGYATNKVSLAASTNFFLPSGNIGIKALNTTASLSLGTSSYDNNPLAGLEYSQVTGGGRLDLKVQTWGTGSDYALTTGLTVVTPGFDTNNVRVGIGTTSPAVKLHALGSSTTELRLQNSDANNNYGFVKYETSVAGVGGNLVIGTNASGGGYGAMLFIADNNIDFLGGGDLRIVKSGNVGIGTYSPNEKLHVTGNIHAYAPSGIDAGLFASQAAGSTTIAIRSNGVTHFNGGNVGIGTTSPVSHAPSRRTLVVADTVNGANIEIWGDNGGGKSILQSVGGNTYVGNLANGSGGGATYITSGNGSTYTTILSNGNVGIATTGPLEKLHVVGNIRIDGSSTAAILETGDKTAGEGGVIFEDYDLASTYGAFVDYVIYDTTRDNMRAGTFYAVWNTGQAVYTDTSTVDIGDTSNVVLYAEIDGTSVNLIVNGPTSFTIKYNLKLIK